MTILEGESLVNDATALVLYRAAVGAVVSGSFALGGTLLDFLYAAVAGMAIGIGVAWVTRWALCATEDGFTQIGITLLITLYRVGVRRVGACISRAGLRGGRGVSPSVFQRRRGPGDQTADTRGMGVAHLCLERSDFYFDRPSAGGVA